MIKMNKNNLLKNIKTKKTYVYSWTKYNTQQKKIKLSTISYLNH